MQLWFSRLAPVVAGVALVFEDLVEGFGFFDEDVCAEVGLVEEDGLEADELEHGEEHADDGAGCLGVVEEFAEGDGTVFHEQAAFGVVDHLGDGDGVFVDVEDGAGFEAGEDLLENADEVGGVGGDLLFGAEGGVGGVGVGAGGVEVFEEVREAGVGPGGFFDLLLLHEHLGGGFEAFVLEEAFDELSAGVFGVGAAENV